MAEVTELLQKAHQGDAAAFEKVFPLLYGEMRRLAQSLLRQENPGHTLQATALVHEVYLKLSGQDRAGWKNRSQVSGVAAQAMRRILVDHARKRKAAKREASEEFEYFVELPRWQGKQDLDVLDEALDRLASVDARKAKVVELRFFGGLTEQETAECLQVSLATVQRDWTMARAWLFREIAPEANN